MRKFRGLILSSFRVIKYTSITTNCQINSIDAVWLIVDLLPFISIPDAAMNRSEEYRFESAADCCVGGLFLPPLAPQKELNPSHALDNFCVACSSRRLIVASSLPRRSSHQRVDC